MAYIGNVTGFDTVDTEQIKDGAVTDAKIEAVASGKVTGLDTVIAAAVTTLVDASPATLDTLNELAAALGDDPAFATTVTTSIGLKAPSASPTFTGNVGVGVTPEAWYSTVDAAQVSDRGALWALANQSNTLLTTNVYLDASAAYTYIDTDTAVNYQQTSGRHVFSTANSGTAGTVATFRNQLRLDANGDISFYDTAGTGQKFFWDSSAESLKLTGANGALLVGDASFTDHFTQYRDNNGYCVAVGLDASGNAGNGSLLLHGGINKSIEFTVGAAGGFGTGTPAMVVDTSGNVGIGTTTPVTYTNQSSLTIRGTSVGRLDLQGLAGAGGGTVSGSSTAMDIGSNYGIPLNISSGSTAAISLKTNATERLRINQYGQVGIGTSSPVTDLHIKNAGSTQLLLESGTTGTGFLLFGDANDSNIGSVSYNHSDNSMRFETADAERLRIDNLGNVGIGTSSPLAKLHVTTADGTIYQEATRGAGHTWRTQTSGSDGEAWELYDVTNSKRFDLYYGGTTSGVDYRALYTGGLERLRIDSSGNVGIGTSSPTSGYKLDVSGNIILSSANPEIRFNGGGGWIGNAATANTLTLNTSGLERVRVNNNGDVGIGTNDPLADLHLETSSNALTGTNVDVSGLAIKIHNPVNDTGEAVGIGFGLSDNLGNVGAAIIHDRVDSESQGGLHFATKSSAAGAADIPIRMSIDKNGIVTTPYQPSWNVGLAGAQTISTLGDVVLWNKSTGGTNFVNGGVTLNGTNGRITLPVAGKYLIVAAMRTEAAGGVSGTNLNLRLNGVTQTRFYVGTCLNSGGSYMNIEPRPFIVNAQANDYLYYDFDGLPASIILSASTNTVVSFSGYLIG